MQSETITPYDATAYPVGGRVIEPVQSEKNPVSQPEATAIALELLPPSTGKLGFPEDSENFAKSLIHCLDHADSIATSDSHLSSEEMALLQTFEAEFLTVRKNLVRRNFQLLAMHRAALWREKYDSLADFAKQYAGISSSQLRKILDETEMLEDFLREGLYNSRPRGNYAQLLLQVTDPAQRIPAWNYARKQCAADGQSRDRVRDALRDFCQANSIRFGRRRESSRECERRITKASKNLAKVTARAEKLEPPPCIVNFLGPDTVRALRTVYTRKPVASVVLDVIKDVFAAAKAVPNEDDFLESLHWIRENDPALYNKMVRTGCAEIAALIEKKALEKCSENEVEKTRYHKKKNANPAGNATSAQ